MSLQKFEFEKLGEWAPKNDIEAIEAFNYLPFSLSKFSWRYSPAFISCIVPVILGSEHSIAFSCLCLVDMTKAIKSARNMADASPLDDAPADEVALESSPSSAEEDEGYIRLKLFCWLGAVESNKSLQMVKVEVKREERRSMQESKRS